MSEFLDLKSKRNHSHKTESKSRFSCKTAEEYQLVGSFCKAKLKRSGNDEKTGHKRCNMKNKLYYECKTTHTQMLIKSNTKRHKMLDTSWVVKVYF